MNLPQIVSLGCGCAFLASCGAVESVTQSSFAKLQLPGMKAAVPVVEVREADLEELPLGHDKALAFEKKRKSFWSFSGPVDFKEPSMPAGTLEADGSLLPPLNN